MICIQYTISKKPILWLFIIICLNTYHLDDQVFVKFAVKYTNLKFVSFNKLKESQQHQIQYKLDHPDVAM